MHMILTISVERGHETLQIPIVRLMTTPKRCPIISQAHLLGASVYSLPAQTAADEHLEDPLQERPRAGRTPHFAAASQAVFLS